MELSDNRKIGTSKLKENENLTQKSEEMSEEKKKYNVNSSIPMHYFCTVVKIKCHFVIILLVLEW